MNTEQLRSIIKELAGGTIFSCKFIKKDQTVREMTCRLGVKKGLTGQGLGFDVIEKKLLPVFDMSVNDYRMINLDSVLELRIKGEVYKFEQKE